MSRTNNRIHLKGDYRQEEAKAASSGIYPGMLVKMNSSGNVAIHATEGGWAEKCFVMEDALQGKTVDDVYTSGAIVTYIIALPGTEVNALIANHEDIVIGDILVSNGAGCLQKASSAASATIDESIVAIAMEAMSPDSGNELFRVRVV